MYMYYKYVPTMFVIKKTIRQFMSSFFSKHFQEFLDGRIGLYISPYFDNSGKYLQIALDLDARVAGLDRVIRDCQYLQTLLKDVDIVTTANGLHLVTNYALRLQTTIVDINHQLQEILANKCPSIDWSGSIRITPFGRLGKAKIGYMNPIQKLTVQNVKKLRESTPSEIMSEEEWILYFRTRLIPKFRTSSIENYVSFLRRELV